MKKLVIVLASIALLTAGCGSGGTSTTSKDDTLTVLAASSLTGTFTKLARQFEAENPGVTVKLVFDSSATLVQQLIGGAPGDVLATADQKTIDSAKSAGALSQDPTEFATNVVVLAVPKANPARIQSLGDLNKSGVKYLTCVLTAPCGSAAAALLKTDGVTGKPASLEIDVKSVLAKVVADEADAGLVYATDVIAAGAAVTPIAVPGAAAKPNTYWVGAAQHAAHADLAQKWITFLTGSTGRSVLAAAGFGSVH